VIAINIDAAAIIIMESFGVVSFLMAFLFYRQREKMKNKHVAFMSALCKRLISERGYGKCFSSEWVMDNIVYKRKKIWNATPIFVAVLTASLMVWNFVIAPRIIGNIISFGYAMIIALLGIAAILWTDAFEAFSYASAIHNVATRELDKEDQSYMELASESLEKAFLRFLSLGIAFAVLGPFIPQIFNRTVEAFLLYTTVYFQASEASFKISGLLGILVIFTLPVLMLFFPEFLGRILILKGKLMTLRFLKRRVKK